jgi:hypothetical protein
VEDWCRGWVLSVMVMVMMMVVVVMAFCERRIGTDHQQKCGKD